jgi:hypothetical protein
VHGRYSRAEIEAAHCFSTRRLLLRRSLAATDLLFITLRKSEALFSPSTRYRDLALGPSLFHWESQCTTTEPVVCLGFARYESHECERPMAIRWRLEREIPAMWMPVMALAV